MSSRDPMTELAVTMDQLIDAVKGLSTKLDKLQDEKVQSIAEQMGRMDERLKSNETTAKAAKDKTDELGTLKDKVDKLERFFYGLLAFIGIQLVGMLIGLLSWLLKK